MGKKGSSVKQLGKVGAGWRVTTTQYAETFSPFHHLRLVCDERTVGNLRLACVHIGGDSRRSGETSQSCGDDEPNIAPAPPFRWPPNSKRGTRRGDMPSSAATQDRQVRNNKLAIPGGERYRELPRRAKLNTRGRAPDASWNPSPKRKISGIKYSPWSSINTPVLIRN
jgi:hypothetical protein